MDYKTESFRIIVNHYLKFPEDRYLPFEAGSIGGNTYKSYFRSLFIDSPEKIFQPRNNIYYGSIRWKKIDFNDQKLKVEFNAGLFVEIDGIKYCENRFYLELDTSGWSERSLNSFKHDFDKSRKEAIDSKSNKKILYFLLESKISLLMSFAFSALNLD